MPERKPRKVTSSFFRKPSNELSQSASIIPDATGQSKKVMNSRLRQPEPLLTIDPHAVIFGLDILTRQPISVNQGDLWEGTYIVGVQGMGKTSLLEQVIYQQINNDEAVIVIDPHGDLINSVIAHMPANKLNKTYVLDLKDRDYPFGLSLFSCSDPQDEEEQDATRNQIMHAFEKLWPETKDGLYFKKILRHIVVTLIENPELTLANVKRLLLDKNYRQQYTSQLANSESRSFWQDEYNQLSESKQNTETNPLRGRLDELLIEPVIKNILMQTTKTVNIRALIEERAILLVKLPVNEGAYIHAAPIVGTLVMAMIYAAVFSFADIQLAARPGCTLVVDEFQNFATDEYAKLFEQGRKYKIKQFLAHQHRQQFERGDTGSTNLAATTSAHTIVAFRTIPKDSTELASSFLGMNRNHRPSNFYLYPTEKLYQHPNPTIKAFTRDIVDRLDEAAGQKLETRRMRVKNYAAEPTYDHITHLPTYPMITSSYQVNPQFDFGAGKVGASPNDAGNAINLLDRLIYESEAAEQIVTDHRDAFLHAVAKFWKFDHYLSGHDDNREERERHKSFSHQLSTALTILIREPIAQDTTLTIADIAKQLEHQQKRHALIKTGSQAYQMETRETRLLQAAVLQTEAVQRYRQVQAQTRQRYCLSLDELARAERGEWLFISLEPDDRKRESQVPRQSEPPQPDPVIPEQPEPVVFEVPEPAIEPQQSPAQPELVQQLPQAPVQSERAKQIPASRDTSNMLYAQMKAKAIDPDTTILAALGEYYVMTIKQWMRLFEWKTYPKATPYFKQLREKELIFHKDREGRGGKLVEGDWFFLLTKGANELVKRKQADPLFKFEPNEAEKASGDTLLHTYLVNEIFIHLRLLERTQPESVTIEQLVHERSMRRNYSNALGADAKFYPDGFLRLFVPTRNGLKRRFMFLELQYTTQKDKANWQAKVQKYRSLFERVDVLERFFSTKAPQVLVITMDEDYAVYHRRWTEEVLAEAGDTGRNYSNRFIIGAYDTGMSAMTTTPEQFFCTPRFFVPFQEAMYPLFEG